MQSSTPSAEITVREMCPSDVGEQLAACLSALAATRFMEGWAEWLKVGSALEERRSAGIVTLVAESADGQLIGTASVLFERKLLHGCLLAAHVEDVAVRDDWQGRGVGKLLVRRCLEVAKEKGAYKVVLDSGDELEPFYRALGLERYGSYMRAELS